MLRVIYTKPSKSLIFRHQQNTNNNLLFLKKRYKDQFERDGIRVCRAQTFNRDLGSLFNSIFTQLSKCTYPSVRDPQRLCELFKESFLEIFNAEYLTVEDLKEISARNKLAASGAKPKQASKRGVDKEIDESLNKLTAKFSKNVTRVKRRRKETNNQTLDAYFKNGSY